MTSRNLEGQVLEKEGSPHFLDTHHAPGNVLTCSQLRGLLPATAVVPGRTGVAQTTRELRSLGVWLCLTMPVTECRLLSTW